MWRIRRPPIYRDFSSALDEFALELVEEFGERKAVPFVYCLCDVPREFFEAIFLNKDWVYCSALKKATENVGRQCAYLTQAYILYMLWQFQKNDKEFADAMHIENIESATELVLGENNETIKYLDYFRRRFDLRELTKERPDPSLYIDPRDWPTTYTISICQLVITDPQVLADLLQNWEQHPNNTRQKFELITFGLKFIVQMKRTALILIDA